MSSATHLTTARDSDTGYAAPTAIEFKWEGERRDGKGKMDARVRVDKLGMTVAEGGLMEKVDVLAEIPYVIRKGLAAVTGTKPIIYQVSCLRVSIVVADAYLSISTLLPCRSTRETVLWKSKAGSSTRRHSFPSRIGYRTK